MGLKETLQLDISAALKQVNALSAQIAKAVKVEMKVDTRAAEKQMTSLTKRLTAAATVPVKFDVSKLSVPKVEPVVIDVQWNVGPIERAANDALTVDVRPLMAPLERIPDATVDVKPVVASVDLPRVDPVTVPIRYDVPPLAIARPEDVVVPVRYDMAHLDLPKPEPIVIPVVYDTSGLDPGSVPGVSAGGGGGAGAGGLVGGLVGSLVTAHPVAAGISAAGAVAAGIFKVFKDLETGVSQVLTLLPVDTEITFDQIARGTIDFSNRFGKPLNETISGVYEAVSAGVPANNVFTFMETASKAATAGVTDTNVAVDGLTSVINAFGANLGDPTTAADDLTNAADVMFQTVNFGKITFEQLSANVADLTPLASLLGLKFEEMGAGMAALTAVGVPAGEAATQLRSIMAELVDPASQVGEIFSGLTGVTFPDFVKGGGTLEQALKLLRDEADRLNVPLSVLFGNIRSGQGAMTLTNNDGVIFTQMIKEMANAAGATDKAFLIMQDTIDFKWDRILTRLKTGLAEIGLVVQDGIKLALDGVLAGMDLLDKGSDAAFDAIKVGAGEAADLVGQLVDKLQATPQFQRFEAEVRDVADSVGRYVRQLRDIDLSTVLRQLEPVRDLFVDTYHSGVVPFAEGVRELAGDVVEVLTPAVEEVSGWIRDDLLPVLAEAAPLLDKGAAAALAIGRALQAIGVGAVRGVGAVLLAVGKIAQGLGEVIKFVAELEIVREIFSTIASVVSDLALGGLSLVIDLFGRFLDLVKNLAEAVEALFRGDLPGFLRNVGEALGDIAGAGKDLATGLLSTILDGLLDLGAGLLRVLRSSIGYAVDGLGNLADFASSVGGKLVDAIKQAPALALEVGLALGGLIVDGAREIGSTALDIGAEIGTMIVDAIKGAPEAARLVGGALSDMVVDGLADIGDRAAQVGDAIGGMLEDGARSIRPENVAALARNVADTVTDAVSRIDFSAAGGAAGDAASKIGDVVAGLISDGFTRVTSIDIDFVGIGTTILDGIVNAAKTGGGLAQGLGQAVGDKVQDIATAVAAVKWDEVATAIVGGVATSIKSLSDLAQKIGTAIAEKATEIAATIATADWHEVAVSIIEGILEALAQVDDFGKRMALTLGEMFVNISDELAELDYTEIVAAVMAGIHLAFENTDKIKTAAVIAALLLGALILVPVILVVGILALATFITGSLLVGIAQGLGADKVWNAMQPGIEGGFGFVKTSVSEQMEDMQGIIDVSWGYIRTRIETDTESVKSVTSTAWPIMTGIVKTAAGGTRTAVVTAFDAIRSSVSTATDVAESVIRDLADAASYLTDKASELARTIREKIPGLGGVFSAAFSGASGLLDGIYSAATDAAGAVRDLASAVRNLPGLGSISSIASAARSAIPFEWGGVVNSPVVGLVGEAGRELILPLTKSWDYQRQLLATSGVIDRLYGEFTRQQQAASFVGHPAGYATNVVEGDTIVNVNMTAPPSRLPADQYGDAIGRRILNAQRANRNRRRP